MFLCSVPVLHFLFLSFSDDGHELLRFRAVFLGDSKGLCIEALFFCYFKLIRWSICLSTIFNILCLCLLVSLKVYLWLSCTYIHKLMYSFCMLYTSVFFHFEYYPFQNTISCFIDSAMIFFFLYLDKWFILPGLYWLLLGHRNRKDEGRIPWKNRSTRMPGMCCCFFLVKIMWLETFAYLLLSAFYLVLY